MPSIFMPSRPGESPRVGAVAAAGRWPVLATSGGADPTVAGTQWTHRSGRARLFVTAPDAVDAAVELVRHELAEIDHARGHSDGAELSRAEAAGGPYQVSRLLAELVGAALRAARDTDGAVDPTVGALGAGSAELRAAGSSGPSVRPAPDWRAVRLAGTHLTVPAGTMLDLGATATAYAADRCAELVADRLGVGVLFALGGHVATAGEAPPEGWRLRLAGTAVALPAGAAVATAGIHARAWDTVEGLLSRVVDAHPGWRTASVAAYSCVRAATIATAAVARGPEAPDWLDGLGVPARLVGADRSVHTYGGWPGP